MQTSNTAEMVTISRAEYEQLQQENAQLEAKSAKLEEAHTRLEAKLAAREQEQAQVITSLTLQNEWLLEQLKLSRQTMANWLLKASEKWLQSVYDLLHKQLCKEPVLHADETTLQVLKSRDVPPPASPTCGCTAPAAAQNRPLYCMSTSPPEKRNMRKLS